MNKLLVIASFFLLFIYVNGGCVEGTLACTDCTDATTCNACLPGFFVSTKVCAKCISNCKTCADATTCGTCADGYYKDTTCKACMTNCAKCTTATDCTESKATHWIKVGGTAGVAATLETINADCAVAVTILDTTNVQACVLPKYGFKADKTLMTSANLASVNANCEFARGSICVQPKTGYHVEDFFKTCHTDCKFCKTAVAECLECTDSGKKPNNAWACTASTKNNCILIASDGKCTLCQYGYGPIADGSCAVCNAAHTATTGSCAYCGTSSYFYDTTATPRRQLQTYSEDLADTKMADVAQDCVDFTASGTGSKPTGAGADQCKFWKSTDGTAIDCLYCNDGYGPVTLFTDGTAFAESQCTKCYTGCDSCTAGGSGLEACLEPQDHYYLQFDSTGATPIFVGDCYHSSCITCTGPFVYDCTKWEGYFIAAATATLVAPTTATKDDNCKVFVKSATAANEKCIAAAAGYFLNAGVAEKCLTNCKACTGSTFALCTTPAEGFWKDTTEIKACGKNCLECTSATLCTKCAVGYGTTFDSVAGTCINQCISDCASCWSTTFASCDACATGFTANSTSSKCEAPAGTTGNNTTGNGTGTTYGFLLSTIAGILSLFLILIL